MANIKKIQKHFTTTPQVDWLTLRISYLDKVLNLAPQYGYKVMPYTTRVFKRVIEITDLELNEVIATITDQPLSSALPSDLILIKFHNKLLYTADLYSYVKNFCEENRIWINAVSRLDIAVDFTSFANSLHPEIFLKRWLSQRYIKKGWCKAKPRGTFKEYNTYEFDANLTCGKSITYDYMRWGTANNGLKYYLYNKTKELQQVKEKPYIRKRWEMFLGEKPERDVWRLEFSIVSNDLRFIEVEKTEEIKNAVKVYQERQVVDTDTGEITTAIEVNVKSIEVLQDQLLIKVFSSLVNKYMVFYVNHKNRKTRNKPLTLFKNLTRHVSYTCERSLKDSTNTDKNFIVNLRRTYEDLRNKDVKDVNNLSQVVGIRKIKSIYRSVIKYQIGIRGLQEWAAKKQIENYGPDSPYNYHTDLVEIRQADKTEAIKAKRFNKKE